jgi:hypothetical protein
MAALGAALSGRGPSAAPLRSALTRSLPLAIVTALVAGLVAALIVAMPSAYRGLFAIALFANGVVLAVKWPRAAAVAVLLYLPFIGLVRRLLIPDSGWSTHDPLLLVAPAIAVFLVYRVLAARKGRLQLDLIYKLVLGLLALALLQTLNPAGNGILAGLGGLLFLAVPLLWFIIGRELADRRTITFLLYGAIVAATVSSAYGLWQTEIAVPSWDQAWVDETGYAALTVGETLRAFGTFPSAAEYAAYSGVGLVLIVAFMMNRRFTPVIALPFIAVATFLASGRTVIVLSLLAIMFLFALRTRSLSGGTFVMTLGFAAVFMAAVVFGPALDRIGGQSSNSLVSHQVGGLLNPLDPEQSTLIGHLGLMGSGIAAGFEQPFGHGTGVTNLAGAQLSGNGSAGSEVDISDAFISLGLPGGLMYLTLVVLVLVTIAKRYARTGDPLVFAIAGALMVTLGQWLNGGYYALAAMSWFVIGWATRPIDPPEAIDAKEPERAAGPAPVPATNGHGDPAVARAALAEGALARAHE